MVGRAGLTLGHMLYFVNFYTYSNEVLSDHLRIKFSPLSFVSYGLAGVLVNCLSYFFSTYSFFIGLSLCCITGSSLLYLYIVESPFFLYRRQNIKKLYQCLLTICKRNFPVEQLPQVKLDLQALFRYGKYFQIPQFKAELDGLGQLNSESFSPADTPHKIESQKHAENQFEVSGLREQNKLFKQDVYRFFKILFIFGQVEGIFALSLIVNKYLGITNVHLNGVLVSLFQTSGYLAGIWFVLKLGRRTINVISSALLCVFSLLILGSDLISNLHLPYAQRSGAVRSVETGNCHQYWGCF